MDADGSHRTVVDRQRSIATPPARNGAATVSRFYFEFGDHGSIKLAAIDMSGKMRTLATESAAVT